MEKFVCLYCSTRIKIDRDPQLVTGIWFQSCPCCHTRYLLEDDGRRVRMFDLEEIVIS